MIQLVQVRGQSPGLFPANLLPDCARMGFEVKTISEHATPGLEQIVLVDYADPLRSLAYIRRLREQGCCCFVLLVAPEEALPPFAELSGLGIAAFVPVPVQRDAVVSALEQAAVQVQTIRNHYIPRSDYVQLKQTLDTMYISRMYTMATSGRVQPPADLAAFNAIYGTKFDTERFACFGLQVDPGGLQASGREPAWPYLQDDAAAFFESHGLHAVQLRIAGFCGYLVTPGTQRMPALAGELYAVLRRAALPSGFPETAIAASG